MLHAALGPLEATKSEPTPTFFFSLSYTLRHRITPQHCVRGSRARPHLPENSFVWGIPKVDSRPPNSSPGMHAPAFLRQNSRPRSHTHHQMRPPHASLPRKRLTSPPPPTHLQPTTHHAGCTQHEKYQNVRLVKFFRVVLFLSACDHCGGLQGGKCEKSRVSLGKR